MGKFIFTKKELIFWIIGISFLFVLSFGFGYFFGRTAQIESDKSFLQKIPEVNLGRFPDTS